jgi:hypothetical protein
MRFVLIAALALITAGPLYAGEWDVYADTWEATDALGRKLPGYDETGPPRAGKTVGIFYFLWLGAHGQTGPHDISKILAEHPDAMEKPDHEAWGPENAFHHWGEPLYGYYLSDDAWVLGQHARMLSDAGVDAVIFDVTNQATYKDNYEALCQAFTQADELGGTAPRIAFLCPFWDPARVVQALHEDLYGPGLHDDLWFRWRGKPLIMADPDKSPEELRDYFTFRKPVPSYFTGPGGPNEWGWLEVYPQHVFRDTGGNAEQMTVGVAQNATQDRLAAFSEEGTRGRSFHDGENPAKTDETVDRGLNFAEQWKRALHVDPSFIFITGWNEWVAMRLPEFNGVSEPVMFVDQFTQEKSRDIEPMRGGHGDSYYYQMVANIRRYKGVRQQPPASGPVSIRVDGRFDDWTHVMPEFRDHVGDALNRDHPGWGDAGRYVNRTGRNDFALMKVARDDDNVYFYARTANNVSPHASPHWMMLFIDIDRNKDTGWEGYDFLLNRLMPASNRALVEMSDNGWNWEAAGEAQFATHGKELELRIPRSVLGLDADAPLDFEFKWADNLVREGNVMEFWVNGDTAPPGRFNYRYFVAPVTPEAVPLIPTP